MESGGEMDKTDVTIQSQIDLKSIVQSLWVTIDKQDWQPLMYRWQMNRYHFMSHPFLILVRVRLYR